MQTIFTLEIWADDNLKPVKNANLLVDSLSVFVLVQG